jgi:chromosome partitioning protein
VAGEVRKHFEHLTYKTAIPRSVRLGEAPSHGKSIIDYDPSGAGAESYRQLAREFLRRQPKQQM